MDLFFWKSWSVKSRLAAAVCQDVTEAYARFVAARGSETINALALCSVDDAVSPYIVGATLKDIGMIGTPPEGGVYNSLDAYPADWSWSDEGRRYRYEAIIDEMLKHQPNSFTEHGRDIFEGIVEGLKKFDASGRFKGKLPRDQMLLVLWINDPSEHNAKAMVKWVGQMNPIPVAKWFKGVFSY